MKKWFALLTAVMMLVASAAFAEANRTIGFDAGDYVVYLGQKQQVKATVEKVSEDAPGKTALVWKSSDESIARVANNGAITGVSAGRTVVRAEAKDDESIFREASVEVRVPVNKITADPVKATLLVGSGEEQAKIQIKYEVQPAEAFHKDVVWSSSNEAVAVVDGNGVVTAMSKGSATIQAKSTDPSVNKSASVKITVNQAVIGIAFDADTISVPVNKNRKINATVSPADAGNKKLVWTSADESIATVDGNGSVKGISEGTTVISAAPADNENGPCTECIVTVVNPVKKITFSEKTLALPVDATWTLEATVEPENATDRAIAWSSSNDNVVTVDEDGHIKGISKGKAQITASAMDGSGVKASINVSVEKFDLVFFDRSPQYITLYTSSIGGNYIQPSTQNNTVVTNIVGISMMVTSAGAQNTTDFEIIPVNPGLDVLTFKYGGKKLKRKVYVSPDCFTPVSDSSSVPEEDENAMKLDIASAEGTDFSQVSEDNGVYRLNVLSGGDPGINTRAVSLKLQKSVNVEKYTSLVFEIMDYQGSNSPKVVLIDEEGNLQADWTEAKSNHKEWTQIKIPMSMYGDIELSKLAEIRIGEQNEGEYYIKDIYVTAEE